MGDWGEDGDGATSYFGQASDFLDETTSGFGTFVHDLTTPDPATGHLSSTIRGAVASALLCIAMASGYVIWRLCHIKPEAYVGKVKVEH